jgi:hypothetical protein
VEDKVMKNMRNVLEFGKKDYEIKRFEKEIEDGSIIEMKKYLIMSVCLGIVFFLD